MKFFIYLLSLLLIICCQPADKSKVKLQNNLATIDKEINQEQTDVRLKLKDLFEKLPGMKLPLKSQKLDTLYKYNEGEYSIDSNLLSKEVDSSFFTIKKDTNDSLGFYNIIERKFFPILKLKLKDYNLIACLVHFYESDVSGILLELYSFDRDFNPKDYLIIYNRYTFETTYDFNFFIDKQFNIHVNKLIEDYYDYEKEDFIKDGEKPETKRYEESYIISDEGVFEKIENKK